MLFEQLLLEGEGVFGVFEGCEGEVDHPLVAVIYYNTKNTKIAQICFSLSLQSMQVHTDRSSALTQNMSAFYSHCQVIENGGGYK